MLGISLDTPLTAQVGLVAFALSAAAWLFFLERSAKASRVAYGLAAASTLVVIYAQGMLPGPGPHGGPFAPFMLNAYLSMALLGATFAALIWGKKKERGVFLGVIALLLLLRFFFSGYFVIDNWSGHSFLENYRRYLSFDPGALVMLRWIWGILAPLILLVILSRPSERSRAVFYVLLALVLTGETLGIYLSLFHRMWG